MKSYKERLQKYKNRYNALVVKAVRRWNQIAEKQTEICLGDTSDFARTLRNYHRDTPFGQSNFPTITDDCDALSLSIEETYILITEKYTDVRDEEFELNVYIDFSIVQMNNKQFKLYLEDYEKDLESKYAKWIGSKMQELRERKLEQKQKELEKIQKEIEVLSS